MGYIVHKAIEADKCKAAVKKLLTQPGYLENNYRAFAKYDGCSAVVHIDADGEIKYESRTGEKANLHHLDEELRRLFSIPAVINNGIVLFAEAWWPGRDQFPAISGGFRRHAGDLRLQLAVFDALTRAEFEAGTSTRTFEHRHHGLLSSFDMEKTTHFDPVFPAREYTTYVTAKQLAEFLVESGGYDGLILRDPKGLWEKGNSGNGGEIIKVKHRVSIDVRVSGASEGLGKYVGKTGALQFKWKGTVCEVGTGLTDKERALPPDTWLDKIVEVECLGFTPDGIPREPSFKGVRHDKLVADND